MALYARSKPSGGRGPFKPCPPGPQQAVCCDVVDLGIETSSQFKTKSGDPLRQHKVRLKWQSSHLMDDGKPYIVGKKYTLSLDRRATLRKDLEAWRGKPFTDSEAEEFDLERLLGVNAFIAVHHTAKNGEVYADVVSLMACPSNLPKLTVRDYVRQVDREKARATKKQQDDAAAPDQRQPGDEDYPADADYDPADIDPPPDDPTPF